MPLPLPATALDWAAVTARALSLACLYQAAGAALFVALFGGRTRSERACRLGRVAALCALLLVPVQIPLMAARMAGEFSGSISLALLQLAWHSRLGWTIAVQMAGLALLLWGLRPQSLAGRARAHCVCGRQTVPRTGPHPRLDTGRPGPAHERSLPPSPMQMLAVAVAR